MFYSVVALVLSNNIRLDPVIFLCVVTKVLLFGFRGGKTRCLGFQQSETKISLVSYIDLLENRNFTCSKFRYNTFRKANNKGAEPSARTHI